MPENTVLLTPPPNWNYSTVHMPAYTPPVQPTPAAASVPPPPVQPLDEYNR